MKLFLWTEVLWDYRPGLAFVLAHDEDQARRLLKIRTGMSDEDFDEEFKDAPIVIDYPYAHFKYGGS